jgi:hypothetical protein
MHLLVVALLAAAPDGGTQLKLDKRAREALLTHASRDLNCPVEQLKIKGRDLQGDIEVSGCDREEGYSLLGGKWLSLMQSLLNLDVATVVGGLNRSEGSTAFIEPEVVEAVCSFPKILQGLGYLHVKFKRSPDAVTKAWLEKLMLKGKAVESAELPGWADRISECQRVLEVGDGGVETPVMHYVLDPKDESEWNHGSWKGLTLLQGGSAILWTEWW